MRRISLARTYLLAHQYVIVVASENGVVACKLGVNYNAPEVLERKELFTGVILPKIAQDDILPFVSFYLISKVTAERLC